jgi:AraC-like DNA-binding protein
MPESPDCCLIAVSERSYARGRCSESHDHWQLVLSLRGMMQMSIGQIDGVVTGNRMAVVPPAIPHEYSAGSNDRFLVVDFDSSFRPAVDPEPLRRLDARMSSLFRVLQTEAAIGGLADPAVRTTLGAYLSVALGAVPAVPDDTAHAGAGPAAIAARARAYIDADPGREMTVDQIAFAACASPRHLTRCFAAAYGATPARYIRDARLSLARTLLIETDLPAGDVSVRAGFPSQAHFTRLFAREFGLPPGEWRRKMSVMDKNLSGMDKPATDTEWSDRKASLSVPYRSS